MVVPYSGRRSLPFHYVSRASVGNILAASLGNSDVGSRPRAPDVQDVERSESVFRPVSVAKNPPPSVVPSSEMARTAHGYVATKWASEVFLEHLHERYPEWPVTIHRPSLVVPQGRDVPLSERSKEEGSNVGLDLMENLRRYSSLLHAIPVLPAIADKRVSISGVFDVVSLGELVKEMVDLLRSLM